MCNIITLVASNKSFEKKISTTVITEKEKTLQAVLDKTVDGKKVYGTTFAIKKDSSIWLGASGNMSIDQPY